MSDYRTNPEWLALMKAVCANPDDDLPRLVMADWLDEFGGDAGRDRAWSIRDMIARASSSSFSMGQAARKKTYVRDHTSDDGYRLKWEILFAEAIPGIEFTVRRGFVAEVWTTLARWCGGPCDRCVGNDWAEWRDARGASMPFCEACGNTGQLAPVGHAVVMDHPVESVSLTDARAFGHSPTGEADEFDSFSWRDGSRFDTADAMLGDLPAALFELIWTAHPLYQRKEDSGRIVRFTTRKGADSALSTALIAWALAQSVSTTSP